MDKQMNNIGRQELVVLREKINDALKPLGQQFGLTLAATNGTYADTWGTFKLEIATTDTAGNKVTKESAEYLDMCKYSDTWNADWLFQIFVVQGVEYKITGWSRRSTKYPLLARNVSTGRGHKFTSRLRQQIETQLQGSL